MRAILFFLLISSLLSADTEKLYQNGKDIKVEIYKNRSFKVLRADGSVLRKPTQHEQFFIDKSNGALKIDYKIIEKIGGVDIEYSLVNPTLKPQAIPDFTVDGLTFKNVSNNGYIEILNTLNFQYMHKRELNEQAFLKYRYFDVNGENHVYPEVYSPVIVAHDKDYAVGSSLNFFYQKDRLQPHMRVYKLHNGLWRYSYNGIDNRKLEPKESLRLTLSIRFAKPKNWLYTLFPYKKHFNKLYGKDKNIVPKDLRPISGIILSYGSAAYENYLECQDKEVNCDSDLNNISKYNLYGYNYYIRPDLYGLDGKNSQYQDQRFITTYIQKLQKSGFKRSMIWTHSGQYWRCPKGKIANNDGYVECTTNYPPQFMNAPSQKVKASLSAFKKFKNSGIALGLWWGRSGQVPYPLTWNPKEVIPFDIEKKTHIDFYLNELAFAKYIGATEIGLDAYSNMKIESQLPWLIKMKKLLPDMKFYNEGTVSDFLHTQTSAFIQPQNPWVSHGKGPIEGRASLMDYLNPNAEVIVYFSESTPSLNRVQQLINWGYTPLILAHPNIFENQLLNIRALKIK